MKAHRLARLAIEMHAGELADGRDLAGLGVAHFVHEADRSVADLAQRGADFDDVAREQLALIGDVLLHRRHAAAGVAQIGRRQPEPREEIPGGLVELADIPHDVHVADMVAVPRIDRAAIGHLATT